MTKYHVKLLKVAFLPKKWYLPGLESVEYPASDIHYVLKKAVILKLVNWLQIQPNKCKIF